jgi:hypothetical protein
MIRFHIASLYVKKNTEKMVLPCKGKVGVTGLSKFPEEGLAGFV